MLGETLEFGLVDRVAITVLVDNRADLMLESTKIVRRYTQAPLLAEHGFSALIELQEVGIEILWDAGVSRLALVENAHRMRVDLTHVTKIALSHGHWDHYAAMTEAIHQIASKPEPRRWDKETPMEEIQQSLLGRRVPLIVHPAAFRERWNVDKDGKMCGPRFAPRAEWEAAGAEIVESEVPYQLAPGCWTTGAVPRRSFEKAGVGSSRFYRQRDRFLADDVADDQSVAINVRGKGLVVLSGCAHAGIVNTVKYAQEISGGQHVYAILGGFHLGRTTEQEVDRTIDEIIRMEPEMVVPSHCTGFYAIAQLAQRMPQQFILGAVGTTYLF